ncbi:MAG: helix-turn-helix transcriptional regulator [Chloroflexi bacterium]|nr:helix-turn-helix transcriptional regulator [Chloroflexota bacterium]
MYDDDEGAPCYVISIAARMVGVHAQTLRYYERVGLVEPSRSQGHIRLYSPRDIERIRLIQRLINDLGVNLAGVDIILNLTHRIAALEQEIDRLEEEIRSLRETPGKVDTPTSTL